MSIFSILSRPAAVAAALAFAIPSTAFAAEPAWEYTSQQGNTGKVTQVVLSSAGYVGHNALNGSVKIGTQSFGWGGTKCVYALTNTQIAGLMTALTEGYDVLPVYRKQFGNAQLCLVLFTVVKS